MPDLDPALLRRAAELIRAGALVAFPTETVYGLGANALDEAAVDRIYRAKERPPGSPLIVHVSSLAMARSMVREWPHAAQQLAERFWPGALTLVLPKAPAIPDRVTGGLSTVGVRMPAHPVALALIKAAGVPIAAPSANPFTHVSPTTAAHVRTGLGDRVALVLDGGPARIGIESTVLALHSKAGGDVDAVLLRPGMVTQADLESVLGVGVVRAPDAGLPGEAHPSPGMHSKHYSPRTPVVFELPPGGRGAYLWITAPQPAARCIRMPDEPSAYAAALYATLHELDAGGFDWIAIEKPPAGGGWTSILNRLERATGT